ncbi:MAG: hypothetical protein JSV03_16130, partial [Planctomycetota bacterium]
MNQPKDEKWLDDLIARSIDTERCEFDAEQWKQRYPEEFQMLKSQAGQDLSSAFDRHINIWRIVWRSRFTRYISAAMIFIEIIVGIYSLSVSNSSLTLAWADVQAAFIAKPWVHLKYDNGREQWISLQDGKTYFISEGGRKVFVDRALNIRQIYDPTRGRGSYISEDRPVRYKDNIVPPWRPQSAWESVVGMSEYGEWHIEQIDGRQLVRFDRYHIDALGRRLVVQEVWADPNTRLPVRIRERLPLALREEQGGEFITGEFDFPQTGPLSIFDLGVPHDLPIVRWDDNVPTSSVAEVLEAGKKAKEQFPVRYRAVVWQNKGSHEVDVVWRNGDKIRHARYFSLEKEAYHLPVPTTIDKVLEWAETQPSISIGMYDGVNQYYRRDPHPELIEEPEPTVRVLRARSIKQVLLNKNSWPHEELWPYINRSAVLLEKVPNELEGCIGLRVEAGDIRRDFFIDPGHDYICVRWIWWKERSGKWEKEREYEYSDFVQLPEGQWYARKWDLITYADPERGTWRGGANWTVDVK